MDDGHIDDAGGGNGGLERRFCYFMEYDAFGCRHREMEDLAQMPGDGLAFTVVVRGEDDFCGVGDGGAEFRDLGVLRRHNRELDCELVIDVDGFQTIGNLSDMSETGETLVLVFAEIAFDFLALGGGFHDDEGAGATFIMIRCAGAGVCGGSGSRGSMPGIRGSSSTFTRWARLYFELGWHDDAVLDAYVYNIRIQFYTCLLCLKLFLQVVYEESNIMSVSVCLLVHIAPTRSFGK